MLVPLPFWVLDVLGVLLLWRVPRARSPLRRRLLATGAALAFVLALSWAAMDIWTFRDGFPIAAPGADYPDSHGMEAARVFIRGFASPLLVVCVSAAGAALWGRRNMARGPAEP